MSSSESPRILLGFEVLTGKPVYMNLHHTAVFGITALSGKTRTLEAIIVRSGLMSIAFKTKRGEAGFSNYHEIQPFYRSRADWMYVEGLLNVALGEKVKYQPFMRWAIQKVTEGNPETLRDILANAERCRDQYSRRREVFEQLIAYLRIVVPELERWTFSEDLELENGVNVMDISEMQTEVQQLVIASSIEEVFKHKRDVIVIVPEAWEQLPQGKMTPVKWVAEQFVRKGASIGNYLFLDSQDIGGIDKTPLRQCDNWLMGRMKESHEVERIINQLLGLKIAKEDIQTLPLGHFFAAVGDTVKKIYVLPAGIPEDLGVQVALGKMKPEQIKEIIFSRSLGLGHTLEGDELVYKEKYEKLLKEFEDFRKSANETLEVVREQRQNIEKDFEEFRSKTEEDFLSLHKELSNTKEENKKLGEWQKKAENLANALAEISTVTVPSKSEQAQSSITLESSLTEINVEDKLPKVISMTTDTPSGKLLYCAVKLHKGLVKGQKDPVFTSAELQKEAAEYGWQISNMQLGKTLAVMIREGWLIQEGKSYRLPTKVPFDIKKIEAEK